METHAVPQADRRQKARIQNINTRSNSNSDGDGTSKKQSSTLVTVVRQRCRPISSMMPGFLPQSAAAATAAPTAAGAAAQWRQWGSDSGCAIEPTWPPAGGGSVAAAFWGMAPCGAPAAATWPPALWEEWGRELPTRPPGLWDESGRDPPAWSAALWGEWGRDPPAWLEGVASQAPGASRRTVSSATGWRPEDQPRPRRSRRD